MLADAAEYDASCASRTTTKRDLRKAGFGSTEGSGIRHAYTPDGRCVSLLKFLMTNLRVYDRAYGAILATSEALYRAVSNPVRLKPAAMRTEMPKQYPDGTSSRRGRFPNRRAARRRGSRRWSPRKASRRHP